MAFQSDVRVCGKRRERLSGPLPLHDECPRLSFLPPGESPFSYYTPMKRNFQYLLTVLRTTRPGIAHRHAALTDLVPFHILLLFGLCRAPGWTLFLIRCIRVFIIRRLLPLCLIALLIGRSRGCRVRCAWLIASLRLLSLLFLKRAKCQHVFRQRVLPGALDPLFDEESDPDQQKRHINPNTVLEEPAMIVTDRKQKRDDPKRDQEILNDLSHQRLLSHVSLTIQPYAGSCECSRTGPAYRRSLLPCLDECSSLVLICARFDTLSLFSRGRGLAPEGALTAPVFPSHHWWALPLVPVRLASLETMALPSGERATGEAPAFLSCRSRCGAALPALDSCPDRVSGPGGMSPLAYPLVRSPQLCLWRGA